MYKHKYEGSKVFSFNDRDNFVQDAEAKALSQEYEIIDDLLLEGEEYQIFRDAFKNADPVLRQISANQTIFQSTVRVYAADHPDFAADNPELKGTDIVGRDINDCSVLNYDEKMAAIDDGYLRVVEGIFPRGNGAGGKHFKEAVFPTKKALEELVDAGLFKRKS